MIIFWRVLYVRVIIVIKNNLYTEFPFKITETIKVKVRFKPNEKRLVIEEI